MKLRKLTVECFRLFRESVELDFTDAFGRPKNLVAFVGPNGTGKTTLLDAIAISLEGSLGLPCTRPDLPLNPRRIVHKGCRQTKVKCELQFSLDELDATRELLQLAQLDWSVPDSRLLTLTWSYPDINGRSKFGWTNYEPQSGRALLWSRRLVTDLLATSMVSPALFQRVGGVFTFDQQRSTIKKSLSGPLLQIIRPDAEGSDAVATSDPREILLALALKAQARSSNGATESPFAVVRRQFAELCPSKRIVGLVDDGHDQVDVQFSDGRSEFDFFGLSSGEQMVLTFLLSFVERRIHRSLVLIDELELHLHPVWQRKLLNDLSLIGAENQLFVTTHSPYLRDIVPADCIYSFGDLDDNTDEVLAETVAHA